MAKREVLLVLHPTRPAAKELAASIVKTLSSEGFTFISSLDTGISGVTQVGSDQEKQSYSQIELVLVLGGDGTILDRKSVV